MKTIPIPDEVAEVLEARWGDDLPRQVLESVALEAYRQDLIGEGQLQRWLGFPTRMEAHAFLKEHSVPLNYTLEDLEQGRQTFDRLGL
jgi:Uncharacterised protein family (UPF0175)